MGTSKVEERLGCPRDLDYVTFSKKRAYGGVLPGSSAGMLIILSYASLAGCGESYPGVMYVDESVWINGRTFEFCASSSIEPDWDIVPSQFTTEGEVLSVGEFGGTELEQYPMDSDWTPCRLDAYPRVVELLATDGSMAWFGYGFGEEDRGELDSVDVDVGQQVEVEVGYSYVDRYSANSAMAVWDVEGLVFAAAEHETAAILPSGVSVAAADGAGAVYEGGCGLWQDASLMIDADGGSISIPHRGKSTVLWEEHGGDFEVEVLTAVEFLRNTCWSPPPTATWAAWRVE